MQSSCQILVAVFTDFVCSKVPWGDLTMRNSASRRKNSKASLLPSILQCRALQHRSHRAQVNRKHIMPERWWNLWRGKGLRDGITRQETNDYNQSVIKMWKQYKRENQVLKVRVDWVNCMQGISEDSARHPCIIHFNLVCDFIFVSVNFLLFVKNVLVGWLVCASDD